MKFKTGDLVTNNSGHYRLILSVDNDLCYRSLYFGDSFTKKFFIVRETFYYADKYWKICEV